MRWCRCLQADLVDSTKQFTEQDAKGVLQGILPELAMLGARMRCECRLNPSKPAQYGVSCSNVKQIKF